MRVAEKQKENHCERCGHKKWWGLMFVVAFAMAAFVGYAGKAQSNPSIAQDAAINAVFVCVVALACGFVGIDRLVEWEARK